MTSNSHSSDEGAILVAIAGANSTDADSGSVPDHQSGAPQSSLTFQPDALSTTVYFPNNVGAETNAPARKTSGWAAKESWTRHQALIKQLYLHEKKPLKEVMRHMEDQHGFRATSVLHAVLFS